MMFGNLLSIDMGDFLSGWYGILLFALIDIIVVILIAAVTYRWFFKYFLDFLCGLAATIVTLPVWLTVAAISTLHIIRTNDYATVFTSRYIAGKGGKTVLLRTFTVADAQEGELTGLGRFLRKTGVEKLPAVFDLLTLKMSLVGVKPLSVTDEKFVSREDYGRFSVRPGYFNPLLTAKGTAEEITYAEMFRSDKHYAEKYSLFGDFAVLFTAFVRKIRGEKNNIFGETAEKSYAETLLESGEIERADYEAALAEGSNGTEVGEESGE